MLSIFFYRAKESVNDEKLIVFLRATNSGFVVDKYYLMTAVLPVPAEPIKSTGFFLFKCIFN
jgi:hypothetical protein